MEELRIYGINISAITGVVLTDINQVLSLLVLSATLIYTIIQIADKVKNKYKKFLGFVLILLHTLS